MASKVFVVSVVLLFSIAVVGAIPKYAYELRSQNKKDLNCIDAANQLLNGNFCTPYYDILNDNYLVNIYPNANEDFYRNVSQQLTAFCASQCKRIVVTLFNCNNETDYVTYINDGICGKINQEFCLVHHLRGTTAGTILTVNASFISCPENNNTLYCIEGACQRSVTQWANYMDCCASPLLRPFVNFTSCGIANTTVCSSGTVTISSSVFIMIAIAIIQMYWM